MQVGIVALQHAQRAGNVEAADRYLNTAFEERLRQIKRARELVRLNTDHHDYAGARVFNQARELLRPNARVGFVERMDLQFNIVPENAPLIAVTRQTEEGR